MAFFQFLRRGLYLASLCFFLHRDFAIAGILKAPTIWNRMIPIQDALPEPYEFQVGNTSTVLRLEAATASANVPKKMNLGDFDAAMNLAVGRALQLVRKYGPENLLKDDWPVDFRDLALIAAAGGSETVKPFTYAHLWHMCIGISQEMWRLQYYESRITVFELRSTIPPIHGHNDLVGMTFVLTPPALGPNQNRVSSVAIGKRSEIPCNDIYASATDDAQHICIQIGNSVLFIRLRNYHHPWKLDIFSFGGLMASAQSKVQSEIQRYGLDGVVETDFYVENDFTVLFTKRLNDRTRNFTYQHLENLIIGLEETMWRLDYAEVFIKVYQKQGEDPPFSHQIATCLVRDVLHANLTTESNVTLNRRSDVGCFKRTSIGAPTSNLVAVPEYAFQVPGTHTWLDMEQINPIYPKIMRVSDLRQLMHTAYVEATAKAYQYGFDSTVVGDFRVSFDIYEMHAFAFSDPRDKPFTYRRLMDAIVGINSNLWRLGYALSTIQIFERQNATATSYWVALADITYSASQESKRDVAPNTSPLEVSAKGSQSRHSKDIGISSKVEASGTSGSKLVSRSSIPCKQVAVDQGPVPNEGIHVHISGTQFDLLIDTVRPQITMEYLDVVRLLRGAILESHTSIARYGNLTPIPRLGGWYYICPPLIVRLSPIAEYTLPTLRYGDITRILDALADNMYRADFKSSNLNILYGASGILQTIGTGFIGIYFPPPPVQNDTLAHARRRKAVKRFDDD